MQHRNKKQTIDFDFVKCFWMIQYSTMAFDGNQNHLLWKGTIIPNT